MAAGQKHHTVGTLHIKVGHAIVFERETHLEDQDGGKHPVKSENRVVSWDEVKSLLSADELGLLGSISERVLSFDDTREKEAAKAAQAAPAEAATKSKSKGKSKE